LSYTRGIRTQLSSSYPRVKISIVKQPAGTVGGFSLEHYRPGRVYDVSAHLANYLVAEGFAVFDRREDEGWTGPETDRQKSS
jgi:hypothetical protein